MVHKSCQLFVEILLNILSNYFFLFFIDTVFLTLNLASIAFASRNIPVFKLYLKFKLFIGAVNVISFAIELYRMNLLSQAFLVKPSGVTRKSELWLVK